MDFFLGLQLDEWIALLISILMVVVSIPVSYWLVNTFLGPFVRRLTNWTHTILDDEIVSAMKLIWERMKMIVEPSCAVPLAAVLKSPKPATTCTLNAQTRGLMTSRKGSSRWNHLSARKDAEGLLIF